MAKGGRIGCKRKTRNNVRLQSKGSDESDEDYRVDEDEFDESEDEYCSSLAEDESEKSLVEFEEEEEEEWVETKVKKVGRSRGKRGGQVRKNNGFVKPRKKKITSDEEEEEEEEEEDYYDDDDDDDDDFYEDFIGAKHRKKNKVSHKQEEDAHDADADADDFIGAKHRKKNKVSHKQEEDDDDDDDDFIGAKHRKKNNVSHKQEEVDEFEDGFVTEKLRKKSRISRSGTLCDSFNENYRKKKRVSYQEVKEDDDYDGFDDKDVNCDDFDDKDVNYDDFGDEEDEEFTPNVVLKQTRNKKPKKKILRRKNGSDLCNEIREEKPALRKKKTISGKCRVRRRKCMVNSDSDFVSSGSSDYEYTISEEDWEQVREDTEICRRHPTTLRSSSSLKMIKDDEILPAERKRGGRKGKEKVVDLKIEFGKQVCGICLSEEGKRTVRGILNCCSHYFCFACIMEWSKVETRCPLCKQRFATISRTTQVDGRHNLGNAVFPVPERDQVYQPSEEELRGYLDPYENVLCTECQQGGDDAFMLLCDLCDSPAHTYCVGLGREVPEGNWYCDGCRPTLASSNVQPLNLTPDHGASNNLSISSSPATAVRETFDLNEVYVPDTPLTQVTGHTQSPRHSLGDPQAGSPALGSGAFTLFERRRIQRQIQQMLNSRNRQSNNSDAVGPVSRINLFGSSIGGPENLSPQERLPDFNTPSLSGREVFSPRLSSLRGQAILNQASTSTSHSFVGISTIDYAGINARVGGVMGHQQHHPCSGRSNNRTDSSTSSYQFREVSYSSLEKERG